MSEQQDRFVDRLATGRATLDQIEDYIAEWHQANTAMPVDEFLGMTESEYLAWLEDPRVLRLVAAARAQHRTLEEYAAARTPELLAARATDESEERALLEWLRERGYIE